MPIVLPIPAMMTESPGFVRSRITLLTRSITPSIESMISFLMGDTASPTSSLMIMALTGTWCFSAVSSTLYLSTSGPPMATPMPSATSPVFSPSSFSPASTSMARLILPSFCSRICLMASPGLPTFPPGPSALSTNAFLPSMGTSATTTSFRLWFFGSLASF